MNADRETSSKDSFDAARDQRAHDLEHVSEKARERIDELHNDFREEREHLWWEQATRWDRDVADEVARLRRDQPAPHHTPTGRAETSTAKPLGKEEMLERATRNVEQANNREIRATYVREDAVIEAVVAQDLSPQTEREPEKDVSLGITFYRSAVDRDDGRKR